MTTTSAVKSDIYKYTYLFRYRSQKFFGKIIKKHKKDLRYTQLIKFGE